MPKSNSALNKFDKDTPDSIERKQYQELIANEFNDARSQVIKRLFEQSATYAEIFDKQQTIGNTVIAYTLGKELGAFKDSIDQAKVKLEENEAKPFDGVFRSYATLINSLNAYINSTGSRSGEVSSLTTEVRNLAPNLYTLYLEGLAKMEKVVLGKKTVPTPKPKPSKISLIIPPKEPEVVEEKPRITDNDLINLFILYEKIQSGYAEGQQLQGINLAGVVSVSKAEKERLTEFLQIGKEIMRGINLPRGRFDNELATVQARFAELTRQSAPGLSESSTTRYPKLPANLVDRSDPDFFEVPAKVDGDFVAPPRRPNREGAVLFPSPLGREGIDFNRPSPPPYSPLGREGIDFNRPAPPPYSPLGVEGVDFNVGRGSARGGRKGVNSEMARNYELIYKYSGFPYFVPPSAPPVVSKNPRSRVNVNTEGSGKKKGKKSGKPKYNDI
jgi:hypothetical protein